MVPLFIFYFSIYNVNLVSTAPGRVGLCRAAVVRRLPPPGLVVEPRPVAVELVSAVRRPRTDDPPHFARVNQNIAAAAMLLRGLSEPNDPHE